jgi:hypothetical protein
MYSALHHAGGAVYVTDPAGGVADATGPGPQRG